MAAVDSVTDNSEDGDADFSFSESPNLEDLRRAMFEFSEEREWRQFHTARNLMLALVGEIGELAELFQWRGDSGDGGVLNWSAADRQSLRHELSDVLLYLVRLADVCRVDLPAAAVSKMAANRRKYPVSRVRGDSRKYTQYSDDDGGEAGRALRIRDTPDGQDSE